MEAKQHFEYLMTLAEQFNDLCDDTKSPFPISNAVVNLLQNWLDTTGNKERASILQTYFVDYSQALFPDVRACLKEHQRNHPQEFPESIDFWNANAVSAHIHYAGQDCRYDDITIEYMEEQIQSFDRESWDTLRDIRSSDIVEVFINASSKTQSSRANILTALNNHPDYQETIRHWCHLLPKIYIQQNPQTPYAAQFLARSDLYNELGEMMRSSFSKKNFLTMLATHIPNINCDEPMPWIMKRHIQQGWCDLSKPNSKGNIHQFLYDLLSTHGLSEHMDELVPDIQDVIEKHQFLSFDYMKILTQHYPHKIHAFVDTHCLEILSQILHDGNLPRDIEHKIEVFKILRGLEDVGDVMDQDRVVDSHDLIHIHEPNFSIQKQIAKRFTRKKVLNQIQQLGEVGPKGLAGSIKMLCHLHHTPNMIEHSIPVLNLKISEEEEFTVLAQHQKSWQEQYILGHHVSSKTTTLNKRKI